MQYIVLGSVCVYSIMYVYIYRLIDKLYLSPKGNLSWAKCYKVALNNFQDRTTFAQAHQNWTIEDCKNVAWSDES